MEYRRVVETGIVAAPIAVGNALAAIQGINWLGISAGITSIGMTTAAVFIRLSLDRAKLKRDIALLDIEVATKQLELDEARQRAADSTVALKYSEATKDLQQANALIESNAKLEQTASHLADELKKQLAERDRTIASMRSTLGTAINLNGDATLQVAEAIGMAPPDVGHVEDTGADLPTLAARHDPGG